jgi:hypothetical protein
MFLFLSVCLGKFQICQYFSRENSTDVNNVTTQILHEMVKACFICGAKDVCLFEIRSNMKQRQKWFEAFETFCGKQIYGDNDKHNLLICICNIKDYKNYGLLRNL